MTKDIREVRIASLVKANQVKYSEYPTLVHALPEKVRNRLNSYLDHNWPSMVCLRKLCSEFPFVRLPSYKSLQNFRKKYHYLGSEFQQSVSAYNNRFNRHV